MINRFKLEIVNSCIQATYSDRINNKKKHIKGLGLAHCCFASVHSYKPFEEPGSLESNKDFPKLNMSEGPFKTTRFTTMV